ncbi:hypothetical protein MAR_025987 [Mya arenaria]|uniref:Uncharacterized protein n=1 Tax=Mya arenaria TaxID=6604 RepID=A0ABY7ERP1_MYAAR|nr:hypothetical protein MAR_025987 [Mya arenaria]
MTALLTCVDEQLAGYQASKQEIEKRTKHQYLLSFDFIITLVAVWYILSGVVPLPMSKILQKENVILSSFVRGKGFNSPTRY